MRTIDLTYAHNLRELGGFKTKENYFIKNKILYRSSHLHKVSTNDIKILKKEKIKIIIDFRSKDEFINKSDILLNGVRYYNIPVLRKLSSKKKKGTDSNLLKLVNKDTGGKDYMLKIYKDLASDKIAINGYKKFFKILESNERLEPILWHCSQGKDRAGLASFLLLYALGVDYFYLLDDYLYTNKAMKLKIEELTPMLLKDSNNDTSLLPNLIDVFSAKEEYLKSFLNEVKRLYGSIDNYLINILKVNIVKLKELYLRKK